MLGVESFTNLNLDPNSPRYISRVIGDRYSTVTDSGDVVVNGDYPNLSKFIRVEVDLGVSAATNDEILIPFGFRALNSSVPMFNASQNLTAVSYKTSQVQTTYNSRKNIHYRINEVKMKYQGYKELNLSISNLIYVLLPLFIWIIPSKYFKIIKKIDPRQN